MAVDRLPITVFLNDDMSSTYPMKTPPLDASTY